MAPHCSVSSALHSMARVLMDWPYALKNLSENPSCIGQLKHQWGPSMGIVLSSLDSYKTGVVFPQTPQDVIVNQHPVIVSIILIAGSSATCL